MKLLLRQRVFAWFDSYDIYDEDGSVCYTVKDQLSWGHCFRIWDASGAEVGMIKQVVLTWLPRFDIYVGGRCVGTIRKELTFFKPKFTLDMNGWTIDGDWFEWDYSIRSASGETVAVISKELLHWSDVYVIDAPNPSDALPALLVALAIDAEKCSRGD